jgi:hypothetical protein
MLQSMFLSFFLFFFKISESIILRQLGKKKLFRTKLDNVLMHPSSSLYTCQKNLYSPLVVFSEKLKVSFSFLVLFLYQFLMCYVLTE